MKFKFTKFKITILLSTLIINGCSYPLLNSEMIENKFGSYGLDIIENSSKNRISFLFSIDDHYIALNEINAVKKSPGYKKKYHTLALVNFIDSGKVSDAHKKIINGGSIGATFKDYGWSVTKDNLLAFELSEDIHPVIQEWLKSEVDQKLVIHVYMLSVERNHQKIRYAEIIEMHHPGYLTLSELKNIYAINASKKDNITIGKISNEIIDRLSNDQIRQTILGLLNH